MGEAILLDCISQGKLKVMHELGGSIGEYGYARCISDFNGNPKHAISIAHLVNGKHAAIEVERGDIVCTVEVGNRSANVKLYKILGFDQDRVVVKEIKDEKGIYSNLTLSTITKAKTMFCTDPIFVII